MKLNLANPSTGLQKTVEIDDDKKLLPFFEKRMGAEVPADSLGDEFNGYVFRITGGNDKQGFPMMQGILVNHRVRLLFTKGAKCYRPRRTGEKKRKSVRGCIVGPDLSVMNLVMVKKGPEDIPGLTDGERARRLGPKRANNIRSLFGLTKSDDVRKFVVRREVARKDGKMQSKAPKIQRLVTATRLQRKKHYRSLLRRYSEKAAEDRAEYKKVLESVHKAQKEKRANEVAKKKKAAAKKADAAPKAVAKASPKAKAKPKPAAKK